MKKWFAHPTDIHEPLTGAEITGMTFAGTSLSMLHIIISVFIMYFYINVAGISAAVVGTLLLVTRIADGFSDLGMGAIITKTRSRWGTARPWGLRMALPLLISVILTFSVPVNWGIHARTIYACITYFLMFSIAITPAGMVGAVLGTNMTVNPKSRQKNAMISSLFSIVAAVGGNMAVMRITTSMGDSAQAWRSMAIALGLFAFAGQVAQFLLTRERNHTTVGNAQHSPKNSILSQLPALTRNRYFIIMCMVGMMAALEGAMIGTMIFYVHYVLNSANMTLIAIIGMVTMLPMIIGITLTPVITKKIPIKYLIIAGLVVKIITFGINLYNPVNLVLFISFTALRSFMNAPQIMYGSVYLLNTIEYGEYKTGIRANNLIISVSSVWSKIGAGLGGALTGWLLSLGGYDGMAAVQAVSAQNMIIVTYFFIPMVASVIMLILFMMYDLDKQYDHVLKKLKHRRNISGAALAN